MQKLEFIRERISGAHRIVRVIRRGDPSVEIVKFARDEGIDLIVMATHGRTGLAHVLMGSAAEKVMRSSVVPCSR
jgi:nucleotide-binding universal stress UspA family protein